jgi:hypothetical protein
MELTAFGAIMEYALAKETALRDVVRGALEMKELGALKELLERLHSDSLKTTQLLERTRRENINEMVIAPVSGLEGDDYIVPDRSVDGMSEVELVQYIDEFLDRTISFYEAAAGKVPIEEARRAFFRLAKKRMNLREAFTEITSD